MRIPLLALFMLVAVAGRATAQDHLIPEVDVFGERDSYEHKIRHVFARALAEKVVLRSLVLPSFEKEYVVGLQNTGHGIEAFVLEPSSIIWETELISAYESGETPSYDDHGKEIPPEKNQELKKLKARAPSDYRAIKSIIQVRPLPKDLAEDIKSVWFKVLLDAKKPKEEILGLDGVTYHFSARLTGRGEVIGQTDDPDPDSKTGGLVMLAEMLADFSRGKANLDQLKAQLAKTQASVFR